MALFNTVDNRKTRKPASPGPIGTEARASGVTGNGAPGFAYDAKSALFLMSVSSFFGQDKFYAKGQDEAERFKGLVRKVTKADPAWMVNFLTWLRQSGNMRSSAVVGSIEAALVAKGFVMDPDANQQAVGFGRKLAQAGIGRADEIGEAMAYYVSTYGDKKVPKPIKRGLADALVRNVNEYTAAKYNSDKKAWTLGQLIQVLHPTPPVGWQSDLFKYLVTKDYDPDAEIPTTLIKLMMRKSILGMPVEMRKSFVASNSGAPTILKDAGMTWEAMAGWLQGPMDKAAWEAIIPSMGYMALLRNLRNFDEAKISNAAKATVLSKLADENEIKRSKQFPFRFYAAYRAAPSLAWGSALSMALDSSLSNIPTLKGRTLVLVDTSGSMRSPFSAHSEMMNWDAAALFGIALAKAADGVDGSHVDVVSYSNGDLPFKFTRGADVLGELHRWQSSYNIGGGTDTFGALRRNYKGHDRVILITDEQANHHYGRLDTVIPADKHMFTFSLVGYQRGHAPTSGYRHVFGGLTDACFPMIPLIEAGQAGAWPWENTD